MSPNHQKRPVTGLTETPEKLYIRVVTGALTSSNSTSRNLLLGALRARDYGKMLEWTELLSPQLYDSASKYFEDAQLASLIRKYPFSKKQVPGLDPEAAALKKFLSAEHRCKWINRKRRAKRTRFDSYASITQHARSYIRSVIGESPNLLEIYDECSFTSGASIGVGGNTTNLKRKIYAESWSVTSNMALHYASTALWNNIHTRDCVLPNIVKCYDPDLFQERVNKRIKLTRYNKVSFVPKTAKAHRSIAIEPLLNGFVQKGIDVVLRRRLRNRGIDLSNQTKNRRLARLGSMGGWNPYVTIDLAAASDTISYEVVKDLLPEDWFRLLDEVRSPSYMLPGTNVPKRYEKFCSMGNGFCFPLQSLLFAALCHAVSSIASNPKDFSVYGDDIIVRQSCALLLKEVLQEFGFLINKEKSFILGPFRESCGADWYQGQDVRPAIYDKPLTDLREVMSLHNALLRSQRVEDFSKSMREVLLSAGKRKFLRPGREPGDTAFSVPLDVAVQSPAVSWNQQLQTFSWLELRSQPVEDRGRLAEAAQSNVLLAAVLMGASSRVPFALRYTTRPKIVRVCRPYLDGFQDDARSLRCLAEKRYLVDKIARNQSDRMYP